MGIGKAAGTAIEGSAADTVVNAVDTVIGSVFSLFD